MTTAQDAAEAPTGFDPWTGERGTGDRAAFAVPLVVAVTGHRDLVPEEVPGIRARVNRLLAGLRDAYPHRAVLVMSALAEGADRLVAHEALALGLNIVAALPMARDEYARDFVAPGSREEFDRLCAAAVDLYELPAVQAPPDTDAQARRAMQYAQGGIFMCAHCHILLALWDGKPSTRLGGTAQVVHFHHHDYMPGFGAQAQSHRLALTGDESDLVYHIVVSRNRPGGAPADGLEPLSVSWYTTDATEPRTRDLPQRYRRVFERAGEFGREARAHASEIDQGSWPLVAGEGASVLPAGVRDVDRVFCAADWLAMRYQKLFMRTLRVSHSCVFLTGIAYVTYTDFWSTRAFLFAVLLLMVGASGMNHLARRGAWHRKYLDYRALAEGLRVQFYWAAAAVGTGSATKYAHDNFLQMQDPELGWIRNVMRVAGTECDANRRPDPAALAWVVREWIGDDASGQLGYYRRKTTERVLQSEATQRIGRIGLWVSAATLLVLMFVGSGVPDEVRTPLVYGMGCVLLAVGVRQSYAKGIAEAELIKQYQFMSRIFRNAARRIALADTDDERRGVLRALGEASLEEHAQWILMYRERSVGQEDIVRLS
ncbi:MAG: hypothetical protein U1F08_13725 [Steroidobacteraceae bacterium]